MSNSNTDEEEPSGYQMDPDLRARREETWDMLVVKGLDYGQVVSRLANRYGVAEGTIQSDIHRMDNWLPKLDEVSQKSGVSRLRELRQNRQRLQQMAMEARESGDLEEELRIRRQIESSVEKDVQLSQSLGITEKEPDEVEVGWADGLQEAQQHNEAEQSD